jgi:MFS family permease
MSQVKRLLRQSLPAFREPDFGWYFGGMVATATARRMEEIAGSWLVYSLTGSALALGWLKTAWSLAILVFSLVGGVVADRVSRRMVMVVGHVLLAAIPLVIALLILLGWVEWWYIAVATLLESLVFSFDMPARQSYLSSLLESKALLNAMSLDMLAMAIPGVAFSIVGGAFVDTLGVDTTFFAVSLVFGLSVVLFMRLSRVGGSSRDLRPIGDEVREGLRYAAGSRTLLTVLGLGTGRTLLVAPCMTFLTVFAVDVFGMGALGLGLLSASWAIGRVLGSLIVAFLGNFQHKGWLLLGTGASSGVFVLLFAQSPVFFLAFLILCLVATMNAVYMVVETTILQAEAEETMRGRVAGYLRLTWGLTPLAVLPIGVLTDQWGAPLIIGLTGLCAILFFVAATLFLPGVRRLR